MLVDVALLFIAEREFCGLLALYTFCVPGEVDPCTEEVGVPLVAGRERRH